MGRDRGIDLNKFESMSPAKQYGWDAKKYNRKNSKLNSAHLIRFLEKYIGYEWDYVYHLLKNHKDLSGFTENKGLSFDNRIELFVYTKCFVGEDNKIYTRSYADWCVSEAENCYSKRFYVDPISGLLCKPKIIKRRPRVKENPVIEIDGQKFKRHNGVYYEIKLIDRSSNWRSFFSNDVLFKVPAKQIPYMEYGKPDVYCWWKRQVNEKELKKIKRHINKMRDK